MPRVAIRQTEWGATAARVVLIALASGLLLASHEPWSPLIAAIGIGYLIVSLGVGHLTSRGIGRWTVWPLLLIDVAVATGYLVVAPPATPTPWVIYAFPLLAAAQTRRLAALLVAGLSIVGLAAVTWYDGSALGAVIWPGFVLAGIGGLLTVVGDQLARIQAEQRKHDQIIATEQDLQRTRTLLRQEQALQKAAVELAGVLDDKVARAILTRVAHDFLGQSVVLATPGPNQAVGVPIDDQFGFSVEATSAPLPEESLAWLKRLAPLARTTLARCATHQRLRREEAELRATLEVLPTPVVVWRRNGEQWFSNPASRILASGAALVPPASRDGADQEVVIGDPARTFVATTQDVAQGELRVTMYREITREREALRAKDALIALIGHELRNPLTSIHGYSQMMSRQLGIVQEQVDRLNRMIADFMVAARSESDQLPLERKVVDLVSVAKDTAERFCGASPGHRLRLELPDQAPVEGDAIRLSQILDNLLTNAAKYSPPEEEILLSIRREGDEVLVAVVDHGIGIAPEHLPHLFDRFYRVPGEETKRVTGLGLGLSIVRDLVIAHGGRVWAESAGEGQGSTFKVSLPAAAGASTPAPPVNGLGGL